MDNDVLFDPDYSRSTTAVAGPSWQRDQPSLKANISKLEIDLSNCRVAFDSVKVACLQDD